MKTRTTTKMASFFKYSIAIILILNCHFLTEVEAVSVVKKGEENDIVLKVSTDQQASNGHHFSGEWLESPWGDLYQFRAGDQSWLTAREHCLSLNSDLAIIRNTDHLDWILSHYAPISSRFAQRLVQIGLYAAEGTTHQWKWMDGTDVNKSLEWTSGEPYDHSMEGRERCGLLNVEKKKLDDVDCESTSADHHAIRYVCQRTSEKHKEQQKSNNYIWGKIEQLFGFFGIGGSTPAVTNTNTSTNDYEDEVTNNSSTATHKFSDTRSSEETETSSEEEASVIKTLAALPKIESFGETKQLKELGEGLTDGEGSGHIVSNQSIEKPVGLVPDLDEKKLDKMITKMEEMIKSIDELNVVPSDKKEIERTTVGTPILGDDNKVLETEDKVLEDSGIANAENKLEESERKELDAIEINEIEDDFNIEKTKNMPRADIEPPNASEDEDDEDCDENSGSGSGESEEVEEKSQNALKDSTNNSSKKRELSQEKEDHIKEFLGVLRLFLDRAEHGDLRKLLDDNSGKTLLDRMKNAIREANRKEFEMLEELEDIKKKGDHSEDVEKLKVHPMSSSEQKEIFKKISSAVMKAAKEDADKVENNEELSVEGSGMEKFEIAKEKVDEDDKKEGKIEILKSSNESAQPEKEKTGNDDYYGDYLEDNNVVKVSKQHRKKKDAQKTGLEKKETSTELPTNSTKEASDEIQETKEEQKKVKKSKVLAAKISSRTETAHDEEPTEPTTSTEPTTTTTSTTTLSPTTTTEPTTTTTSTTTLSPTTTTETTTTTTTTTTPEPTSEATTTPTTTEHTTTTKPTPKPSTTTKPKVEPTSTTLATSKPVTVGVRKVSKEEMEKLEKTEAKAKVTLLPPLPTFPTFAPFTFPTFPTLPTTKPTPPPTFPTFPTLPTLSTTKATTPKPLSTLPPPKIPTLEEILGNLNDQFKKLLTPPKLPTTNKP